MDAAQKADMRAYMSLVSNVLGNAEVQDTNIYIFQIRKTKLNKVFLISTLVFTKATIGSISAITNLLALINGNRPKNKINAFRKKNVT